MLQISPPNSFPRTGSGVCGHLAGGGTRTGSGGRGHLAEGGTCLGSGGRVKLALAA